MRRWLFLLSLLFALSLSSCGFRMPRETFPPLQTAAAAHYKQHGDAASLRNSATLLHTGMRRDEVLALLGLPDYSPTDNQDYYPTELQDENGFTLVLVINYHAEGTARAETIEWFFLDYIGE